MAGKGVVILVDNKKRDLTGDALIAYHLKSMGINCFLEPLEAYKGALAAHRPDMIVFNHLTGSHLVTYSKRLAELGVLVGVLPNEGILYDEYDLKYSAGGYHKGAHIDYFFCWNRHHKDAIIKNMPASDMRVEVIGNPKFDFYFSPYSGLFSSAGRAEGEKPRVLVCTNFVFAKYKELPREFADRVFAPWKDKIPLYSDYWSAIEANHEARRVFMDFLRELVSASKYTVVIRPHPGEDPGIYRRWYDELDGPARENVVFDTDSNITSLILSCDIEISCETCTTALESWIAGKPTIELVFGRHPMFYHQKIAALNVLCDRPEDIVALVDAQLEDPGQESLAGARRAHLDEWCGSPDGTSALRMAKVIAGALSSRKDIEWGTLTFDERRKGIKLKLLAGLDIPYNYDPLLFIKKRAMREKYSHKDMIARKNIRPSDVAVAMSSIEKSLEGR